jgi:hypothetical protein
VYSTELVEASWSSGAPLLPGVPDHLSSFRWYQAEEEELYHLLCCIVVESSSPAPLAIATLSPVHRGEFHLETRTMTERTASV